MVNNATDLKLAIRETEAKSVLTRSKLPASAYCINPYVGCAHGCVYCYARFMRRFTGHDGEWGTFVDVRANAASVLARQLRRDPEPGVVLLGSVTDCYQPLERRYRLTRHILEALLGSSLSVSILTKSDLVLRDVDILTAFDACEVGLTITAADDRTASAFEPRAPAVSRRMAALEELRAAGVSTYAFIGPILPGLTDVDAILDRVAGSVDYAMAEALNTKCGNWNSIERVVAARHRDALREFTDQARSASYWADVEAAFANACTRYGLVSGGFFRHDRRG